jgi:hypothetical protein
MNDERLIQLMAAQTAALGRIANALEAIALTNAPAPNFVKPISIYADFDFTRIGARVNARDPHGPTELEWGGYLWTRRSPQNKFGYAIWYSRATGKDADGNVKYARLISFKQMGEAEPLPHKVEALVSQPVEHNGTPTPPAASDAESELEKAIGPRQHVNEHLPATGPRDSNPNSDWPSTEVEFLAWLKANNINGKETRSALGTDAKSWIKANPGKGWPDVAHTISAALGRGIIVRSF